MGMFKEGMNNSATLHASWELKLYGDVIASDSYLEHYTIKDVDPTLPIGYVNGEVKITKKVKPDDPKSFEMAHYMVGISLPFNYDTNDPLSEGNKVRMELAIKQRDTMIEKDLAEIKELCLTQFN